MENLMDATVKGSLSVLLIILSLLGLGKIVNEGIKKDYAYINYDGGYSALGYISGIRYVMNISMENDEGQNYASNKEEALDLLKSFGQNDTIKLGIFLKFNNAYEYSGSTSNFTLTINTNKYYSDGTTTAEYWLEMIERIERVEKGNYRADAYSYLYFESAPWDENPLVFIKNLFI